MNINLYEVEKFFSGSDNNAIKMLLDKIQGKSAGVEDYFNMAEAILIKADNFVKLNNHAAAKDLAKEAIKLLDACQQFNLISWLYNVKKAEALECLGEKTKAFECYKLALLEENLPKQIKIVIEAHLINETKRAQKTLS